MCIRDSVLDRVHALLGQLGNVDHAVLARSQLHKRAKVHQTYHPVSYTHLEEGVNPSSILVITFTRAAATEMQKRYEQMTQTGCAKPAFGTFHSVFFMILKLAYRYDAGSIVREEQRVEFLRELLRRHEIETEDESEFISGVLSEISMVKGEMIGVEHYYAKSCSADVFRRLYKGYEAALRGAGLLDFDDMLVMCRELFDQRADILQAWQRKYRYILIDEFQDINRIQYEVCLLYTSRCV